ncbi:MAG: MCP four helix bundle domain-containing protein [Bryobacteraceae bacterium]
MKNWRIGVRITAGFAAVIAITVALGVFAYEKVGGIQENTKEVAENALQRVFLLGRIEKSMYATIGLAYQHVLANEAQKKAVVEAEIQGIRSKNSVRIEQYEKLLTTERGRALLTEFNTVRAGFMRPLDAMIAASRAGTAEGQRHALQILEDQVRPMQAKYVEATENMVNHNKASADESGKSAQALCLRLRAGDPGWVGVGLGDRRIYFVVYYPEHHDAVEGGGSGVTRLQKGDLARSVEVEVCR